MQQKHYFSAVIEREDNGYVSLCPELDIASQDKSVEEAKSNLIEAIELFLENADSSAMAARLKSEVFITRLEIAVG